MKTFFLRFSLTSIASLAIAFLIVSEQRPFVSFFYGLLVFTVNMGLLVWLASSLFNRYPGRGESDKSPGQRSSLLFSLVFLLKLVFLGAAVFVGLVFLKLSPWYFVGGAGLGLAEATALMYFQNVKSRA